MSIIDASIWGEFKVIDLFERIERGKGSGAGSFADGNIPYIAASFANNGFVRNVEDKDGSLTSEGNCIALIVNGNGGIGRNTYQDKPFVGSSDLQLAYHPRLNQWNGLFLVACLNKSIERYGYNFYWKRTGDAFATETVFLPQTPNGSPDWDYMERTMKGALEQQEKRFELVDAFVAAVPQKINTSSWAEFRVGDLFDPIVRAKRRTITSYLEGKTPYVTNSAFNNGVSGYLEPKGSDDIERGQCITVNTVDGSAFWQEDDFLANSSGNGLLMLRRKGLNAHRALFLCAAISAAISPSFTVMLVKDVIEDARIKLPVVTDGSPDWAYMEKNMKRILELQRHNLDALASIV